MPPHDTREGLLYATSAYVLWGLSPLYWHLLMHVPSLEVTLHRIVWCALAVGIVVGMGGRLSSTLLRLRDLRLLATLALTGLLIAFNWGVMIWVVANEQLVEGTFGYYINPLINIGLGVLLLKERLSPLRWAAGALGLVAVLVQTVALGKFPFIAVALGGSFAFYGYFRKTANIGGLDGVFVEALLLLPFALLLLVWGTLNGEAVFLSGDVGMDFLLMLCGPVTALPLVLFAAGARQIRLSTIGFLQYIGPSIGLILAVFVFRERFTLVHALTFGSVWCALLLLAVEGGIRRVRPLGALPPLPPQKS
ncbi:MAG: chloramphenicol resistance permease RarD [Pseudomonadota bacterium]|jgi:chloramphenicol-sensitive protein RarD